MRAVSESSGARGALTLGVAVVVGLTIVATSASAHRLQYPRRVHIEVLPSRIVVTHHHDFSDDDLRGQGVIEQFDADRNGVLDESERDRLTEFLAPRAMRDATLTVDGTHPALVITAASFDGLGDHGADHFGVTVVAEATLSGAGPIEIGVEARDDGRGYRLALELHYRELALDRHDRGRPASDGSTGSIRGVYLADGETWRATLARTKAADHPPGEGEER